MAPSTVPDQVLVSLWNPRDWAFLSVFFSTIPQELSTKLYFLTPSSNSSTFQPQNSPRRGKTTWVRLITAVTPFLGTDTWLRACFCCHDKSNSKEKGFICLIHSSGLWSIRVRKPCGGKWRRWAHYVYSQNKGAVSERMVAAGKFPCLYSAQGQTVKWCYQNEAIQGGSSHFSEGS